MLHIYDICILYIQVLCSPMPSSCHKTFKILSRCIYKDSLNLWIWVGNVGNHDCKKNMTTLSPCTGSAASSKSSKSQRWVCDCGADIWDYTKNESTCLNLNTNTQKIIKEVQSP